MDDQSPIQQEEWDEIERFLLRRMSPEEENMFRVRLSTDNNLKKATDEMKLLIVGVQESSLEAKLDSYHSELPGRVIMGQKTGARIRPIWWLAAASVIAVLLVSAWFLLWNKNSDADLYAEFFEADPGLISAMSSSSDYEFDRGMIDYKTGNYGAAIKSWEPLLTTRPNSDTLNYFLGAANLANDNTKKAISFFEKVTISANSVFVKDACWYLALAQIKNGNRQEAIPYLEKTDHAQKEMLLKKLKD